MAELATTPQNIEIVIQPSRGWMNIPWREIWEYRDLLVVLVQRDFISRYKQTILGPLWHLLQPVITTIVFAVIFGRIAGIPTDGIPTPLFYLSGLLVWNYFAQNITTGASTFVANSAIFGKVYFPRLIVPLATIVSNLIALALQMVPFAAFLIYYKCTGDHAPMVVLGWQVLLLPLPVLHAAILSLGVSLLFAASTAKYRDVIHLVQFITQLWMFATPIIYPLSRIPAAWRWLAWANPICVPVESFRQLLLGHGSLSMNETILSLAMTVVLLLAGLAAFQKVERSVVDSI